MHVQPQAFPKERFRDQDAVRDDDDDRCLERELLEALGLSDRDAETLGDLLGRGRSLLLATAARAVRARQEELQLVAHREALEDVRTERSRRRDREAHQAITVRSARARPAGKSELRREADADASRRTRLRMRPALRGDAFQRHGEREMSGRGSHHYRSAG